MTTKATRPRWPLHWFTTPALLLIFLIVWQAYVTTSHISAFILPGPVRVFSAVMELLRDPSIWRHIWVTVEQTIEGFVIATVLGAALGIIVGKTPWLEQTLNPFVVASQVVPKVALVPLFIVWFGFGDAPKIIIAAVLAFFPIFTNAVLGVKSIDLGHRDVMTSLSASFLSRLFRLEAPSASPYILTGMEVGIVLATIGCVVAQFLGGNEGLGYLLVAEMNAYQTDLLFAVIVLLTVLGFLFYLLIGALRRLIIPWHESVAYTKAQ
jgi:NitT/TauT family transport system permease protein